LERVQSSRRALLIVVGIGAPLLALLVGAGVFLSVTFALRPVEELSKEADRLAGDRGPWQISVKPDTEELIRLTERFDELLAHIRSAFERERRFLDDASHELRTPIAVARTEIDLALVKADPGSEIAEALRSSIEELDRLDRLAADLLVLARARGTPKSELSSCELAGIARRAVAKVLRGRDPRSVVVAVHGDARVVCDSQAFERVIVNLVSNAIDHAATRVDVEVTSVNGMARMEVFDDGPGFPDDIVDRAIDRFTRHPDRRGRGAGLGLAISAEIVAAHGGELRVFNTASGACQSILLRVFSKGAPEGARADAGERPENASSAPA
jgi:signal transduction histidine kinase